MSERVVAVDRSWAQKSPAAFYLDLEEARRRFPSDPSLAYWSVRYWDREALHSEAVDVQLRAFARARSESVRCMELDPLFLNRWKERGWEEAVRSQPRAMTRCTTAGALAWLHWLSLFGVQQALLDRDAVNAMIVFSETQRPDHPEVRWARQIYAYLYGEGALDLEAEDWTDRDFMLMEVRFLVSHRL